MFTVVLFLAALAAAGVVISLVLFFKKKQKPRTADIECFNLERSPKNPLISPDQRSYWEAEGTFNPAALLDDDGRIHLLYRAIGSDGMSRLGYASSADGLHFEERLSYPVYESSPGHDIPLEPLGIQEYNPILYPSGGGWSGCEDPRAVIIDNMVYMTYVAFGGWDSIRIALTSLPLADFKRGRWNWKKPVLISDPEMPAKNWVLFPKKINSKYAILKSVVPKIEISYVDSLDFIQSPIKSERLIGPQPGRKNYWDNIMRGAGAPPIYTRYGWLLLYHAIDTKDPDKYKLGAMLLDLKDPTKILHRGPLPLLSPEMHYENDGKPGVIYASGTVVKDDTLYVYYGGGDRHVCVARAPLKKLLSWLIEHGSVEK